MHKPRFFYSHTSNWITDSKRVFFVPKSPQLIVYTLEHCPNCELLKGFLKKSGLSYNERDLSSAESLTELRVNGVFVNEAPVLQKSDDFYTSADLFPSGKLDTEHITRLLSGE
jgi:glutaredoxin